ncbi:acyl-CoA thioesterase/BAAT N-terminal domain-containing protein [Herbiconiux sp. A18JL235]|uniref:Acyl-CoA thioesterase/BAAT N-terminal domain-containing protein n=1 Tax=Herbiconiux sp. A18JL235 TaxID=3152363 RepID=A0AB39BHJ0_9MICO
MFGFVTAFLPWVVYWILIGNATYLIAVAVAFAVAVALFLVQLIRHARPGSLEVGGLAFFALSLVSAFVLDDAVVERWLQPASNGALFLIALVGVLVGRPFVRDAARSTVDAATAATDGFRYITTAMTWMWVAVFGLMTVSSLIPPLTEGSATIRDDASTLSIVCYWVVPFTLFGVAGTVSAVFPGWFDRATGRLDAAAAAAASAPAAEEPAVEEHGAEEHGVAPASTAVGEPDFAPGGVRVEAPAESLYSDPFPVVVEGLPSGRRVEVVSSCADLLGRRWAAAAVFDASADGRLDLATTAPRSGDWSTAAPGVAVTALRFAQPGQVPDLFVPPVDALRVTIEVREPGSSGSPLARRTVLRLPAAAGVSVSEVDVDGRRGLLALPAADGVHEHPAVACFGGSEGGVDSLRLAATLLASAGFVALVTDWTDADESGAPVISRIPLERFGASLDWLRARADVDSARVAGYAISRGAEGLLAAAAAGAARADAYVALSPSSTRWQAVGDGGEQAGVGSWTLAGSEQGWLPVRTGELVPQLARNGWRLRRDAAHDRPTLLRLRPAYEGGLSHAGRVEREAARIVGERIAAPLFVAAGADDAVWPSASMAAELMRARRDEGVAGADARHEFPHAGHLLRLGLQPTDALFTGGIELGGSREGHAAAEAQLWPAVRGFLQSAVAAAQREATTS